MNRISKTRTSSGVRRTVQKHGAPEPALRSEANRIEAQLQSIRRKLRERLQMEYERGELTSPQRLVMSVVVHHEGLSLKELSQRVSLAHSTVSGIVSRLADRGLL